MTSSSLVLVRDAGCWLTPWPVRSDFLKNLDPPLVEQLLTKLRFEMVFDDFTVNLFQLA
jgi:hypothetical protein